MVSEIRGRGGDQVLWKGELIVRSIVAACWLAMAFGFGVCILLIFIVAFIDFDDFVAPVAPLLFVLPVGSLQGFHSFC